MVPPSQDTLNNGAACVSPAALTNALSSPHPHVCSKSSVKPPLPHMLGAS